MGDINTILFEIITGMRIVKAFSMQNYEYDKFKNQNRGFYKLAMKAVKRINIISPVNELTSAIYFVVVVYLASRQIMAGALSWGSFTVFLTSILLMIRPVKRLSKVYAVIQQSLAAATRVFSILDTEDITVEKDNAIALPTLSREISVEHVWFKYDRDHQVVQRIQGIRFHRAGIRSGCLRSLQCNPGQRFQDACGGSKGRVHDYRRPERAAGGEHRTALNFWQAHGRAIRSNH